MIVDDAPTDREAESRTLANRFRREERIEDPRDPWLGAIPAPSSRIVTVMPPPRSHRVLIQMLPRPADRVTGVREDVHEHLIDLFRRRLDDRNGAVVAWRNRYPVRPARSQQTQADFETLVDVERLPGLPLPDP